MRYFKISAFIRDQFGIATTESGGFTEEKAHEQYLPRQLTPIMLLNFINGQ